jgi:tRNA A-37 threonylcarbamoyl transferase component Bud32
MSVGDQQKPEVQEAVSAGSGSLGCLSRMVNLFQLTREAADTPFELPLADAGHLHDLRVVRAVPNKRLVCRGVWNGQSIYAKIFIGSQMQRYAARDADGVGILIKAGIASPALLHATDIVVAKNAIGRVLIYAAIDDAVNAEQAWQQSTDKQRLDLALRLVAEVAAHHHAGLMQTDLYLKNFLVQGEKLYTLDGDAIKALPKYFARRAALDNLALLLSKFDVLEIQAWLPSLLRTYVAGRGWRSCLDEQWMRLRIAYYRQRAVRSYAERKVLRQCTDVMVSRSWRYFLAMTRHNFNAPLLQMLLSMPDALVEDISRQRLKSGNTCTVAVAEINGRKLVVKRYNIKNFWHLLGRLWRSSRAAASWVNAHRLLMYGIATPAPVALLEHRFGSLRGRAFFIAEYIATPDIAQWLQSSSVTEMQKKSALDALAGLMYKLMLLQISHGDLKASNIHIDGNQPVLIDLDSLREFRCKAWFESSHVRDLRRLLQNWRDQPDIQQSLIEALQKIYGDHPLLAKALQV